MTTKLDGVLKRELAIESELYTLTLSPDGFALTLKGRRKGLDIRWADLVGGEAALATALNASLTANIAPRAKPAAETGKPAAETSKRAAETSKPAAKESEAEPAGPTADSPGRMRPTARPKTESVAKPESLRSTPPQTKRRRPSRSRASSRRSR